MIYSVCTIEVPPGKVNDALAAVNTAHGAGQVGGEFRACWYAELGRLNRILAISGFESADALHESNRKALEGADPFGVAGLATAITFDAYVPFPGVDFPPAGSVGPIFEVRTYHLKRSGLTATFDAWAKVLAARTKVSSLAIVMYAVSGVVPRFMHIWPYASLDERLSLRDAAVKQGVWPPPGGLPHIEVMQSEIFLPAAFSPLK